MRNVLTNMQDIQSSLLEEQPSEPLEKGQVRVRIECFALTANNVTYAATGFDIGYWKFFPTGVDGQGIIPVWGVAQVVETTTDDVAVGLRLYGFYPLADELVITPRVGGQGTITDTTAHRANLPAVYNRYIPITEEVNNNIYLQALLQPLLATSWLLFDWLMDNDWFGAEQVIVGSASSKTGLGLCKYLAEPTDRTYRIVGLTSASNRAFVESLDACDQVLNYDQIDELAQVPSVYIDMSGNSQVKVALHARLSDQLKHSAAVGISHWNKFAPKQKLDGVKPQFFFAPAQIAKRRDEWGPGVVEQKITAAWQRVAAESEDWLKVRVHNGIETAPDILDKLISGKSDPREGHIIAL